ncbi:MAG: L,D-transpeptidase family protein [Alphaproteobacteria bacterium]|nr:L,D-transpeptidase family protein [Alphaproteobacteria bacterium]
MKRDYKLLSLFLGAVVLGAIAGLAFVHRPEQIASFPSKRLALPDQLQPALQANAASLNEPTLRSVYEARNFAPLWIEESGKLKAEAERVASLLADAAEQGLPAALYTLPATPGAGASAEAKARFDIAFSRAAFKYAKDMDYGLLGPSQVFADVSLPARKGEVEEGFSAAAQNGQVADYLRGLEPAGDYPRLKAALKTYTKLAGQSWPEVTGGFSKKDYPSSLVRRLELEGFLKAPPEASPGPPPARAAIAEALQAFQVANNLRPDGQLDRETLTALNLQPQDRLEQIKANMERWRWLPRQFGDRFIVVNVPTANLAMIEGNVPVIQSRVVVGAPDKPTPILATKAVAITLNPSWHIPKSIVEHEIKPKLEKDPGYLDSKNITQENGEYVQNPGPANALGLVKFEMPNGFDVYLHDTPSKQAFLSDDRALSHGCVRVQAIRPLAAHALGLQEDELSAKIAEDQTRRQPISQPIPVYILYWTVLPKDDGTVIFANDIYGRDAKITAALQQASGTRVSSAR